MRISWHFGLNRVKPSAYGGWEGRLVACCNDATAMAALFARAGYEAKACFDDKATYGAMKDAISDAAGALQAGDWFVMTNSGHGGQRDSTFSASTSIESLCLYDRELEDYFFRDLIGKFRAGVNVVVILDTCFSGGMDRSAGRRIRVAPLWVTRRIRRGRAIIPTQPVCNWSLFSAADADETAEDGEDFGAFTGSLLKTVAGAGQTWREWHKATSDLMSRKHPYQHPQFIWSSGQELDAATIFA
jgi:metacaspase-1